MRFISAWLPLGRALAVVDVLLVAWAVAWVVVGVRVADQVDGLTSLSDTVVEAGGAIDASGQAIGALDGVPLIGDRIKQPAERVQHAGQSALASGRSSRTSIHNLSTLLGFAIALIPTVPLLLLYVPFRVATARERRSVDRLVERHATDPRLPRLLAERAVARLPYRDLLQATLEAPESGAGSTARLAEAELARLGIDPDRLGR